MTLALYRKYRPRTFAEIIGQEHVTEPLSQALRTGRLHHAYLFSGPRGCGKTSSARILARSLNCEQGPTPDPCGVCDSCRALAPDGAGSIDVIEIDAASHGGVDDARELRERAFFAPVSSRYKIYVIDEAHMVSSAGFNALLKLVEEPPDYVKFVFATTEPEKVLGTIKSRTHHYPFRLIPPAVLRPYLEQLCVSEGVTVQPAVLPLVVRAGAGSARDTLSVLDQLISGAGPEGVTYARAVALLGVTDAALIDEMVDALAAGDGATAFATIDRVADAGHDPRRFAGDLLERLRDLIVAQQVPDAIAKGLLSGADDELDRMGDQAVRFGAATLSRMADILHTGLVDMRGTTAPRLVLELLTARMLLPGAEDSTGALLQRLERMERRLTLTTDSGPERGAGSVASAPGSSVPSGAGTAASDGGGSSGAGADGGGSSDGGAGGGSSGGGSSGRGPSGGGGSGGGGRAAALAAAAAAANGGSGRAGTTGGSGGRGAGGGPGAGADVAGGGSPGDGVAGNGVPDNGAADAGVRGAGDSSANDAPGSSTTYAEMSSEGSGVSADAESAAAGSTAPGSTARGSAARASAASGSAASGSTASRSAAGGAAASGSTARGPAASGRATGGSATSGSTTAGSATAGSTTAGSTSAGSTAAGSAAGSGAASPSASAPTADRNGPSRDQVGAVDAAVVRRIWDEVLTMVKRRSQRAAAVVREATVREVEGDTIVLLFKHGFHAQALAAAPELLQEALYEVLGGRWKIRCELSGQQGAVVADIPGRPATDDGGGRPDAAATTAPQPRGSASTTGHSAPAPTTSATGPGAAGPTASANGPSVAGPTASAASASPATASAPSRSASAPTTPANSPTVLAFSTTGPSAAVPIASMSAPTVRAATMTAAGTAPGRGPGPATPSDAAAFPDTGGGVAVAIADDDEWPEIAQIGLEADPDEDTPAAALHAPGAASIHTPTATQSPTHVPQTQGGGLKAPAAPRTPPGPKTKTQTQTTQTRTQPPPPATRPAPGQGRAAARAAAAAAAAHKAPPKSARPGDDVWAGTTGEEPPFDPEFDATRPGFDPGDEPVDDLDDAAARLTTEQQALDLLREHLGAEKIGEIETK